VVEIQKPPSPQKSHQTSSERRESPRELELLVAGQPRVALTGDGRCGHGRTQEVLAQANALTAKLASRGQPVLLDRRHRRQGWNRQKRPGYLRVGYGRNLEISELGRKPARRSVRQLHDEPIVMQL